MRTKITRFIAHPEVFKQQLLVWSEQFREVVFMDSNSEYNLQQRYSSYDCVLAVDALTSLKTDYHNAFEDLLQYQQISRDWLFGYLTYDIKNAVEALESKNFDGLNFPDLYFFQPKKLFTLQGNTLEIQYLNLCDEEVESDFESILNSQLEPAQAQLPIAVSQRIAKDAYLDKVNTMLEHIHRGDIYEANFCMEFYAEQAIVQPLALYQKLNAISQPPFAVYFKNNDAYLLCASPERYLRKQGNKVISQPIKGTSKRYAETDLDEKAKRELSENPKERSENIMIVDLVRNDLSHTASKGTVEVEELCAVYSYQQVHQMVSTVVSEVASNLSPIAILRTTFPMGSMTGAPKISAMKLIEELEETKRGLYSGAMGYFAPNGDFDFNVVIRSLLYNSTNRYLSFSVGSAITSQAVAEQEYEECLLKAKAMFEVLR